ncbi:MAG: arginine deiminase family protein [Bacteroidota bacterium]|nr:arginine deiminase family protein [Bacteroidota bacterium]
MNTHFQADIKSETDKLKAVILHTPGSEVENMTPGNAERALYSDILNLVIAKKEYSQLNEVLNKLTKVFQVHDLLTEILDNPIARAFLLTNICAGRNDCKLQTELDGLDSTTLATLLIEGVPMKKDNLSRFLNPERFELRPLHNFFFTRDAAITIGNEVLIGNMANAVRVRESQIMEAIFRFHSELKCPIMKPHESYHINEMIHIEGGDIQVARQDILLAGIGARTSTGGIDFIIDHFKKKNTKQHIIVQELPPKPESFIHLDMAFTLLSQEECLVYEPLILQPNKYQTIHIEVNKGKVKIKPSKNMVQALRDLGMDLKPVNCGGTADQYTQEREQWHSGANFFSFAPGKAIGYNRNIYTLEELNKQGFDIIKASDVISNHDHPDKHRKCIVTIDGSELARGGGGARCMTMPVRRN